MLANITKKPNGTFLIRVSNGMKNGKQDLVSTIYKPPVGATSAMARKAAEKYAVLFEELVRSGGYEKKQAVSREIRARRRMTIEQFVQNYYYLEVGKYTDYYFPEHHIRFIAINDCVDSDKGEDDFGAFRNVMNEMYAKDISRKVRSSQRLRGNAGEPLSPPPYGYRKSPENRKKWVLDPEAAEVVRKVFRLCMEGKGNETIAR